MEKFAGLGVKNMLVTALFTMLLIVMAKVIFTKYPVSGITDFVHAV